MFLAIEEVLKECLHSLTETPQRDKSIRNIITNDDDDFYWLIATAYFKIHETEVDQELLYRIEELYVTVRGSHAGKIQAKNKEKYAAIRVFERICMIAVYRFH